MSLCQFSLLWTNTYLIAHFRILCRAVPPVNSAPNKHFGVDNKTVCVLQFDTGGVSGGRILCYINHFLCTRTGIRHTIEGYFIKVSEEPVSARPFLKHKSVTQTVSASLRWRLLLLVEKMPSEHRANKKHLSGNGNSAFSVSLFDTPPSHTHTQTLKSTQWPKPAELRGCQPKP